MDYGVSGDINYAGFAVYEVAHESRLAHKSAKAADPDLQAMNFDRALRNFVFTL